jgi:hypothetical protein
MAGRLTRFLNLEKKRPARDEPAHEVVTPGRFKPEPELQLSPDHGEQPFLRCPSCEADNGRFAVRCLSCSARLDTEAVQAFNEQLWEERRASKAAEQQADLRKLGETLAQQIGEREQERLEQGSNPPGIRWLARLGERQRTPAMVGAFALFLLSALGAFNLDGHPVLRGLAFAVAGALMLLFLPKRRHFWD